MQILIKYLLQFNKIWSKFFIEKNHWLYNFWKFVSILFKYFGKQFHGRSIFDWLECACYYQGNPKTINIIFIVITFYIYFSIIKFYLQLRGCEKGCACNIFTCEFVLFYGKSKITDFIFWRIRARKFESVSRTWLYLILLSLHD